jgi:hypothetical protein
MPQLVGSLCVICRERIPDALKGRICDGCGNPVHNACAWRTNEQLGAEWCHTCGANLNAAAGAVTDADRQRRLVVAPKGNYSVAHICPKCGGAEYKRRKPEKWIAFIADRMCTACGTRYTPPTPSWAGVVFIVIGLVLAGVGFLAVLIRLLIGSPVRLAVGLPAMACECLIGVIGILAIIHGIRSLARQGKA